MRYKVLYLACDFREKDKNGNRSFDENLFQEYIDDPNTKERIKNKRMMGSLSHLSRDKFVDYMESSKSISVGDQSDYLLANGMAATAITEMFIRDHCLYMWIETMPTEAGETLAKLYDVGYDLPVSMSTALTITNDNKYKIEEVFGLDITNSPAFKTSIHKKTKIT